jgi:putative membrane protein
MNARRPLLATLPALIGGLCLAGSALAADLANKDREFLQQAAQNGHAEVEASKMAATRARSSEVKSFAERMVADHTKVSQELSQLATSKQLKVPAEPSIAQKTKLKLLQAADGDKFDQRYSENFGVKAHQDTIKLFSEAAREAKDADVKAFAQKTLTSLQQHLQMAQSLPGAVEGAESSAAGRRNMPGATGSGTGTGGTTGGTGAAGGGSGTGSQREGTTGSGGAPAGTGGTGGTTSR